MQEGICSVPEDRITYIEAAIDRVLHSIHSRHANLIRARQMASVLGRIVFTYSVIGNLIVLKSKKIYKCVLYRIGWDSLVFLTDLAIRELNYWKIT